MSIAVTRSVIFFPTKATPGSPFASYSWNQIRAILHACLQQAPHLVKGYTIGCGEGHWRDSKSAQWMGDSCSVVEIYTGPLFSGEWKAEGSATRVLASLSYLSCVQMGHDEFFAVVGNQRCEGNKDGLMIGPAQKRLRGYKEIFQSKNWLELPLA